MTDSALERPDVAVIGGGAAGFFAALSVKAHFPEATVTIYEKTRTLLSKVKVSGGGRCNVTNACTDNRELLKAYPRGQACLKRTFKTFNTRHTIEWFESRGVPLMAQDDGCVFPQSQSSQTIIDCLLAEAARHDIKIVQHTGINHIDASSPDGRLQLYPIKSKQPILSATHAIVTTGGSPKRSGLDWLEQLPQRIEDPVPSLFTFNMPNEPITELMGVVVEAALTRIPGTKLSANGPLLITHWGMSGPAILKLSAFGARELADRGYDFSVSVSWLNSTDQQHIRETLQDLIQAHPKQQIKNRRPAALPDRLWQYLLNKLGLPETLRWQELGQKRLNQLIEILSNDRYQVSGKTTYKEEFVTCGGVSFADVNPSTMESTTVPGVFFAGEVLNMDGITGGYNFQAAWTTGYVAGKLGQSIKT